MDEIETKTNEKKKEENTPEQKKITNTETIQMKDTKTIDDVALAKSTTEDYMKGDITADYIPKYIQKQDIVAVVKNAKFSVSQLVNTSRIFKSLVELSWVNSIIAYERLREGLEYHRRIEIREFIKIFDDIEVEIDEKSGTLSTPPARPYHTATLEFQIGIEFGKSVIHMDKLKIALYNFLMRKTRMDRVKKLKAIKQKREGLLLLVIACSIGLPTRKFTNAYDFFKIFAEKYTIVNDSNIIRTLLNLNGIDVDEVKEYGNRALELWEIYKEKFPHFKSIDDDNDDTKTLYSYPTATELRHLVLRANKVIENILYGVDRDKAVDDGTEVNTKVDVVNAKTEESASDARDRKDREERDREAPDTEESPPAPQVKSPPAPQVKIQPQKTPSPEEKIPEQKIAEARAEPVKLFSKKPLNFLMSI